MASNGDQGNGRDRLTPKQLAFVNAYLSTGNGYAAFVEAYGEKKWARAYVDTQVWKLLHNPKIDRRIRIIQARAAARVEISVAWVLQGLRENYQDAKRAPGETAAANRALELIGKHLGMFKPVGTKEDPLHIVSQVADWDLSRMTEEELAKLADAIDAIAEAQRIVTAAPGGDEGPG